MMDKDDYKKLAVAGLLYKFFQGKKSSSAPPVDPSYRPRLFRRWLVALILLLAVTWWLNANGYIAVLWVADLWTADLWTEVYADEPGGFLVWGFLLILALAYLRIAFVFVFGFAGVMMIEDGFNFPVLYWIVVVFFILLTLREVLRIACGILDFLFRKIF